MAAPLAIDRDGLLAALVLDPATFSRNRFFALYQDPSIRRIRRRAALLRGVVRHAASAPVELSPAEGERVALSYELPALGLRRRVLLDPLEVSLVRFAMARARGALVAGDPDRARVEAALARLAPEARPL
jgi:hypothetical protein